MISSVRDRAVASRRNVRFNSPFQTSDEDEGDLPALVRRGITRQSEFQRGKWKAESGWPTLEPKDRLCRTNNRSISEFSSNDLALPILLTVARNSRAGGALSACFQRSSK